MATSSGDISATLLAANQRLLALRQQHARRAVSAVPDQQTHDSQPAPTPLAVIPTHLGWHSAAVTASLQPTTKETHSPITAVAITAISPPATTTPPPDPSGYLKLHPSLALAFLRHDLVAPARLWLLCRYFDQQGAGQLPLKALRQQLTAKDSPWRLCGQRQWRNLLRAGDGIFWHRGADRLWLRSLTKVATAVDVSHLSGYPVALPVRILCQGIGAVRAHFYASFHSGRGPASTATHQNKRTATPIARLTLTKVTGCSASSQRRYESQTKMRVQAQIALGPQWTTTVREQLGWTHGTALFTFVDHKGQQGPAGRTYAAWQLPNCYQGPHDTCALGRQKHLNRHLRDLRIKGAGNEQASFQRLYHRQGAQAVRAYQQDPNHLCYWAQTSRLGRAALWGLLTTNV